MVALSKGIRVALALSQLTFLPMREDLPGGITIPKAISLLHPLPQEELAQAYARANALLTQGSFEKAFEEIQKASDVGPDIVDVLVTRGIIEEKLLRWDEAILDYEKALKLQTKLPFSSPDPTILSNLANAEAGKGLWEDALKDFDKATRLSAGYRGDYVAPRLGSALAKYQLGRKEEAMAYFSALVAQYPLFPDGLAALAVMTYDKDDKEAARGLWERALEQDSRYADLEWVQDIRRWPPALVASLTNFKSALK
jgi:tetratricopeptide (TPR) repeat protein